MAEVDAHPSVVSFADAKASPFVQSASTGPESWERTLCPGIPNSSVYEFRPCIPSAFLWEVSLRSSNSPLTELQLLRNDESVRLPIRRFAVIQTI
jgi:hypothetical protein